MNRLHLGGALAVTVALLHWSCCGCDDKALTPTTVVATPTPTPTATPSTFACTIRGVPDQFRCAAEPPPRFQSIVIAAQDRVRREHPEIFDGAGRVNSQTIYTGWVARVLTEQGHCAIGGTDDEISIKDSNTSSELYDVVTGGNEVWNNYIFTCRPSLF